MAGAGAGGVATAGGVAGAGEAAGAVGVAAAGAVAGAGLVAVAVGETRPGGRAARVRGAVLAATLDELVEHGAGGLSIAAVAARAGVSRATVYRRWPDRRALITAAVLELADGALPVPDSGDLAADLRTLARHVVALFCDPRGGALVRAVVLAAAAPEMTQLAADYWARRAALMAPRVAAAVQAGDLPADTRAEEVIETIAAPLLFAFLVARRPLGLGDADAAVDNYLSMIRGRERGSDDPQ